MPIQNQEQIINSSSVNEHRKIKIGEKGQGERAAPKRYKNPVVTLPLKPDAGSKFEVDETVMSRIRTTLGVANNDKVWAIPVRLLSDDISKAFYVYRAVYNSSGKALCKSNLGDPKAKRYFTKDDPGDKGVKNPKGNLFILHEPVDVDCDKKCSLWKEGEKSDCMWHGKLAVQLENDPVFPQPTNYRTSGFKIIQHLRGSLNAIATITGGVLANIPLYLVETEIESRPDGQKRRHPIMTFMWLGTIDQLRDAAVAEMMNRRRLQAAIEGKHVDEVIVKPGAYTLSSVNRSDEEEDGTTNALDEYVDLDDDGVQVVEAPSTPRAGEKAGEVDETASRALAKIQELRTKANMTDRAYEALVDKHNGNMEKVTAELVKLTGVKNKEDSDKKTDDKQAAKVATDTVADIWGPNGEESSEPSETTADPKPEPDEEPKKAEEPPPKPIEKPKADPKPAPTKATDDAFALFEDDEE